jgi:quinoprotein glucose dehydrogenase
MFDPIVVDGVMYVLTDRSTIAALDAATGKEIWSHPNTGAVGQRGLNYWESKERF